MKILSRSGAPSAERVVGSLDDDEAVRRALAGGDAAFLPTLHDDNDLAQTERFVHHARAARIRRLVGMTAFHTATTTRASSRTPGPRCRARRE